LAYAGENIGEKKGNPRHVSVSIIRQRVCSLEVRGGKKGKEKSSSIPPPSIPLGGVRPLTMRSEKERGKGSSTPISHTFLPCMEVGSGRQGEEEERKRGRSTSASSSRRLSGDEPIQLWRQVATKTEKRKGRKPAPKCLRHGLCSGETGRRKRENRTKPPRSLVMVS